MVIFFYLKDDIFKKHLEDDFHPAKCHKNVLESQPQFWKFYHKTTDRKLALPGTTVTYTAQNFWYCSHLWYNVCIIYTRGCLFTPMCALLLAFGEQIKTGCQIWALAFRSLVLTSWRRFFRRLRSGLTRSLL